MAHHHGHSHLVRRQRERNQDADDSGVQTVVSVRIVTAQNTFTGDVIWVTQTQQSSQQPKTLVAPAERPHSTSTTTGGPTTKPVSVASSTKASAAPSSVSKSNDASGILPGSSIQAVSTLLVATGAPTPIAGSAVTAMATATAAITAAASAQDAGGMSTGAKAGLALGILLAIGALLVGILLVYRRKKKQMPADRDNEKIDLHSAPLPPPPQGHQVQAAAGAAPSIRTQRTMSTAPRLSLRPVTQFDPAFEQRKSAGNLLNVASAAPVAHSEERDLPPRPTSAWERPGASNAPADNPFDDPQHSGSPSANPFGNNAALDATHAGLPDSPPNASPLHSTKPSADYANPAPAIAAADIDPVAAATAMASVAPPTHNLPTPPTVRAAPDSAPASPAWTEDFPASPGPAPTGPPPVAGAVVGVHSNTPPPQNNVHRIQLDFKPSMQDELELHAGQLVRMLHEYDDGWVSLHSI